MSRTKGSFSLAGAIEPLISAPLDAREKVATKAELTVSDNFPYPYIGMETYVESENKKYRLIGNDLTNIENWQEVGAGGGGTSDYTDLSNKPSIENVTLNGNKSASDLGLAKTTDLADFITKTVDDLVNYYKKTETYTKDEVDAIATAIKNSRFEVVATLPTSNIKTNVIYLVPSSDPQTGNVKDEYINLDGTSAGWECIGSTSVDLDGYVTDEELNTALADYVTSTDLTALLADKQDKMQYATLPTPSAELVGKIVEYTGATSNGLTHGYFYECVSDGEATPTYSWQQTNVQPSSGGGGGHTIEDAEGTDLTQRDTLQFGEGLLAEDDSTNEKTVVTLDPMPSEDMDEVVDVYPTAGELVSIVNAFNRGDIYSTDEKMIGQWIDGKPLYQKTWVINESITIPTNTWVDTPIPSTNIKTLVEGTFRDFFTDGSYVDASNIYSFISFAMNGEYIKLLSTRDTTVNRPAYILTFKYTKTTDTAISIGEETEYSTDEKVIGTWIDGKPIYQKTITFSNITFNSANQYYYSLTGLDIDKAWVVNGFHYGGDYVQRPLDVLGQYKVTTWGIQNSSSPVPNSFYLQSSDGTAINRTFYITIQYTKTTT